jgi:hypothetical protein
VAPPRSKLSCQHVAQVRPYSRIDASAPRFLASPPRPRFPSEGEKGNLGPGQVGGVRLDSFIGDQRTRTQRERANCSRKKSSSARHYKSPLPCLPERVQHQTLPNHHLPVRPPALLLRGSSARLPDSRSVLLASSSPGVAPWR